MMCAMEKVEASIQDLRDQSGPIYHRWRQGLLKSLGVVSESD